MPRWTLYAGIVALSALVHLKGIGAPVLDYHSHRQANTAAIARNFYRHSLPPWAPRIDWDGANDGRAATELPVYMWLAGLLWPILGLGAVWGRLLSAACSAATAVLLFELLEKRARGPDAETGWLATEPALLAALAFSVLPVEVYFGRTVQPEALALMSTVASFWAADRYLASRGRGAWGWLAMAILGATLAIGHKLPYAYGLGVVALLALSRKGPRATLDWRLWLVPVASLGLVFAWYEFASTGVYAVPTTKDASLFKAILSYERLPYFAFFQVFSRLPELALTYPGLALFALGVQALVIERKLWFLAGWWVCVLVDVLAGGGYAHYHDYTALPWAPVNAAFIGAGAWRLLGMAGTAGREWLKPAAALLMLGLPAHTALRIHHWYRWTRPELLTASRMVDGVSGPQELWLCNERASSLVLFLIDRRGWSWDVAELGAPGLRGVEEVIAKGARYFLTYKDGIFLDPAHPVSGWFFRRFPVVHDDGKFLVFRLEAEPRR